MKSSLRAPVGAFFLAGGLVFANPSWAQNSAPMRPAENGAIATLMGEGNWRVLASPYSHHWRYSEEHTQVYAIGGEWQRSDQWLAGAAYFRNSFGQPSAYVYVGRRYPGVWAAQPQLFLQWSGGVLYGYRGKFEDKVPLNHKGFAPGALVSAGWAFDNHTAFTAHLLGDAGVMFQFSYDLR